MTVRENEIGKLLVVNTGFDLSGNTDLRIVLQQPDLTVITKTSSDGVTAPAVDLTVEVDGVSTTFLANEYIQYPTESGVMTPVGTWKIHGEYVDATPKDLSGGISSFQVVSRT